MPHRLKTCLASALLVLGSAGAPALAQPAAEDHAGVRAVLDRFYDGWNAHDVDKMVSIYADDVDHINVFGEWHKGKAEIRQDLAQLHSGPARPGRKVHVIEKVRFLTPETAVVQGSSKSPAGLNLGTYMMQKQRGTWLIVSFTNVVPSTPPYKK